MATKTVLKAMCLLLSSPLVVLSRIAVFLDLWDLKCDLSACLQKIDDAADESIAGIFVHALIAAEDRRNPFHPGIDPIGIARAICARLTESKLQGASTIEQQFVRVVSNRYEITLPRKIREQILAIAVSRRRRKDQISSAYPCSCTLRLWTNRKGWPSNTLRTRVGVMFVAEDLRGNSPA